jgi:hypothetical protein
MLSLPIDPVLAASYGGFGKAPSAVLDPKTAQINKELAASEDFKAGLKGLSDLKAVVTGLQSDLVSNELDSCNNPESYECLCSCRRKILRWICYQK